MDLYQKFSDWRVVLYEEISSGRLAADVTRVLIGDMRQAIERLEAYTPPEQCSYCKGSAGVHFAWCVVKTKP